MGHHRRSSRTRRRVAIRRRRLAALTALTVLLLGAMVVGRTALPADVATAQPPAAPVDGGATTTQADDGGAVADAEPELPARLGSGEPVTFAFGGDVHFEPPIRSIVDSAPGTLLAGVAPWLKRADIAMVNLETAITARGELAPAKGYNFRGPEAGLRALTLGGVDVVTLANNHGLDFGTTGLRDTLYAARRANLPLVGAGPNERRAYAPYRATVNGQRIAILAASDVIDDHLMATWVARGARPGMASAKNPARLVRAVREARRTSDTVVVYLHWGSELVGCPTDRQRALARRMVGAGADIVVGTHAHIPLGAGRMGRALVAYGLGNFAFYASREDNTRSGVLEVTATGRRIDAYRWRPARITGGRPVAATGTERTRLLSAWQDLRGCTGLRR